MSVARSGRARRTVFVGYASDMLAEGGVAHDVIGELNRRLAEADRWAICDWAEAEKPASAPGTPTCSVSDASDPNVGAVICLFGERPLTGSSRELLDAVNANAANSPAAVLCYVKADRTLFARTDLAPEERGYGFEQHFDRLRAGEKRIRSRAQQADYDEQLAQLDRFCTEFFRKGGRPYVCFGAERSGPEGALDALRSRLRADLERVLRVPAATDDPRTLKGLAPFERADHDILFGRDRQIVRILDRLQSRARDATRAFADVPVLVLTGRSGEGKSSLLRAGLLGRLERGRYYDYGSFDGVLVEGLRADAAAPLELLAGSIDKALTAAGNAGLWRDGLALHAFAPQARGGALVAAVAVALAELPRDRSGRMRRLFVAVDQLDDILAAADDDTVRDGIIEMLAAVCDLARAGHAWSVIATSTDYVERLTYLAPEPGLAIETSQPPGPDDLWDIVEQSLAVAGYELPAHEVEALVEQAQTWLMRQADAGPVLPLLGALLAELVVERRTPTPLGGDGSPQPRTALTLDGIVDRLADRAFDRAYKGRIAAVYDIVPRLLRQLVQTAVSPAGRSVMVRACADDHPAVRQARPLVDALIAERLLYRPQPGVLRLIHVSIVEHWKLAAEWYAEDRRFQEMVVYLERRAEHDAGNRAAGDAPAPLNDYVDLADALYLWSKWPDDPDRLPADFLRDSLIAWYQPSTWSEAGREALAADVLNTAIQSNDPVLIDTYLDRIAALPRTVGQKIINHANTFSVHAATWRGNPGAVRRLVACGAAADAVDSNGRSPLLYAAIFGWRAVFDVLVEFGAAVDRADSGGARPLHAAAARGSAHEVSVLLGRGADVASPDENGDTPLMCAVDAGDAVTVDLVLAYGAPLDAQRGDGRTALILAAWDGALEVVQALLAHGPAVDVAEEHGGTALTIAAFNGHRAIVHELVDRGATIEHEASNGQTPLMAAAEGGHADVIADLLQRGAAVDHRAPGNATALLFACQNGHTDAVRTLLAHGASIDDRYDDGSTALTLAAQNGHASIVRELAAHGLTLEYDQRRGSIAVQAAAARGHVTALRELLASGGDPAYHPEGIWSALRSAASFGNVGAIGVLLDYGAPVDQADDDEITPLAAAACAGQASAVRLLLSRGAEVSLPAQGGYSALHGAAQYGHIAAARELLAHGAAIELRAERGVTALILAAQNGHAAVVKLLLDAGASIEPEVDGGGGAMLFASHMGHLEIVRLLLAHGAGLEHPTCDGYTPLTAAAKNGHLAVARELAARGAAFDGLDERGWTPLYAASMDGNVAMVRTLLSLGADVERTANGSFTSLMAAAELGHTDVVRELVAHGAAPDHRFADGRTALFFAAIFGRTDAVVALLEAGADPDVRATANVTPIFMAAMSGHEDVVRLLLDAGADATRLAGDSELTTPAKLAAQKGHRAVVSLLLSRTRVSERDRSEIEVVLREHETA